MPKTLAQLTASLQVTQARGDQQVPILAVCDDSRAVKPGALFVAVPGYRVDGHRFIGDAVRTGAVAVLGQSGHLEEAVRRQGLPADLPRVAVPDSRRALAQVASVFYDEPGRHMKVIGVTGTDGKTTTSFLIAAILRAAGHQVGLLNTVAIEAGAEARLNETRQTTLEALQMQQSLAQMVADGCDYAVVEATSHGLAQDRVRACHFDAVVLTNLTPDHLDFHGSFEEYRRAKGRLFQWLAEEAVPEKPGRKVAVVNADDASHEFFLGCAPDAEHWIYALDAPADVRASDLVSTTAGTRFRLLAPHGETTVSLKLPGRFNVANALAAASVGLSQGLGLDEVRWGLESVSAVSGRMERIDEGQPFVVVVDYAHTEHGLDTVLATLRPTIPGRIIVVFGAVGGRDRPRRFGLGRAAARLADFAILANEDPKFEDPVEILRDIAGPLEEAGWREGERYHLIPDRRAAIEAAVRMAQPGDLVLLAGKGHEPSIIIRDESIPWDDRVAAREALTALRQRSPGR